MAQYCCTVHPCNLSRKNMLFYGFAVNLDLYVGLLTNNTDLKNHVHLYELLKDHCTCVLTDSAKTILKKWCYQFCYRLNIKWMKAKRTERKFKTANLTWLESEIKWPCELKENVCDKNVTPEDVKSSASQRSDASTSTSMIIRKPFEELSDRQKRRRVSQMSDSMSISQLLFQTETNLRKDGNKDMADILAYLRTHPENVSKVKAFIAGNTEKEIPIVSVLSALANIVHMRLSKWRYQGLREFCYTEGIAKYPCYQLVVKEKKKYYPAESAISVNSTCAKIELQALLDITTTQLLKAMSSSVKDDKLVLFTKWGFDGASNQSVYHQKSSLSEEESVDSTVFMASLVPLRLVSENDTLMWSNERPSSTTYCRPILFKFMKESEVNVMREMEALNGEIAKLNVTTCNNNVTVRHKLLLTMIDGKIHSMISQTSGAVCDICLARPVEMNNLALIKGKTKNGDMYQYGLSSLHAWIRAMECLLHISYRLDVKKWQIKGEEMKKRVAERKKEVQNAFRLGTGMMIDVVKQGSGTTNTGNVARRFFADPEKTAVWTGLNLQLIKRIAIILQCISSGMKIKIADFKQFCDKTAEFYVELYPWYYMPSSLHKLLLHGAEIVNHFAVLPFGYLSEEASECRNKDFRRFREEHSRKKSGTDSNRDILNYLLLSSDPVLSSIRPKFVKNLKKSTFSEFYALTYPENLGVEFVDVNTLAENTESESD